MTAARRYFALRNVLLLGCSTVSVFSPSDLFAAGEQGVWYDPSDLSTMFQDAIGTTPVTAVEQPVGLILDKSKGLAVGAQGMGATYSGSVTSPWAIGSTSVTRNGATSGSAVVTIPNLTLATTKTYIVSFTVADFSGDSFAFRLNSNGTARGPISANGSYTYRLPPGGTVAQLFFIPWGGSVGQATITNISVREIAGNHASQTTEASRPVLKQGGGYNYLFFDGNDDSLATPSIDFTATDKMTIWAGSRWQSNFGIFIETSANAGNTNGTLYWYFDSGYGPPRFGIRGTTSSKSFDLTPGITAPVTTVFQNSIDLATGTVTARQNAASATLTASGSTSSGSFANQPLYIGRRGNVDLPFNGRLYSLIMRGTTSTDTEIASTETWVNGKTGAY